MTSVEKKITVSCLDCENPIDLTFEPVRGQIITCSNCFAELEILNTQPLELDFYFEEWDDEDGDDDEDWDDDDDSDDDEDWD